MLGLHQTGRRRTDMIFRALHHKCTPTLAVTDPRDLTVREVAYCRQRAEQLAEARITRQVFDAAGRLVASWDPRLWGRASKANLVTVHGLSGAGLLSDSVDSGWQLDLRNEAQNSRVSWDSRGTHVQTEYDPLQRPVTIIEALTNQPPRTIERLAYGSASSECVAHNPCGKLVRHDDGAGTQRFADYDVLGRSYTLLARPGDPL